jgi:hypothetical protein
MDGDPRNGVLVLRGFGPRCQQNVAPDEVEKTAQNEKRNHGEKIGIAAVKKWVVGVLPILDSVAHGGESKRKGNRGQAAILDSAEVA